MKLYDAGVAVGIRYPTGAVGTAALAAELAARLDELALAPTVTFSSGVAAGVPSGDVEAIYLGLADDWSAETGGAGPAWWEPAIDFGLRVVRRANCINPSCTGHELQVVARDEPLLLRAAWLLLHGLGWRHYLPNGVSGLSDLWVVKDQRARIQTRVDQVWRGAVDHLIPSIAAGTSVLTWSDGTSYHSAEHPNGLVEGDLAGAIGTRPVIDDPTPSWLRHLGWTTSTRLSLGSAWQAVIPYGPLQPWDEAAGTGQYTTDSKLYTDDPAVQAAALAYAEDKAITGLDWASLAVSDGTAGWAVDFGDPAFGAKPPVTRQIELANRVATDPGYSGSGVVIQAYGDCADLPEPTAQPDPERVCVVVVEAYRPPGRSVEDVIADYVDARGAAICPLGIYQYLYSGAWGAGTITAPAGSRVELLERANRVRRLPATRPLVLGGEAMTETGCYGLGYYCYLSLVHEIGWARADFTEADFDRHATRFLRDLYPTRDVRAAAETWYGLLLDRAHKPLLSADLVHRLWAALQVALLAVAAGTDEQLRLVELCKYTRFLDLRNAWEAAQSEGESTEAAYDEMLAWLLRIRDSGLLDPDFLFDHPLDETAHGALGLGSIFAALKEPPGDGRGSAGDRPAWDISVPELATFDDPVTGLVALGLAANPPHGLDDIAYSSDLVAGWNTGDTRPRQPAAWIQPFAAHGKLRVWLVPGDSSFTCTYTFDANTVRLLVDFVNQATGAVDASLDVTTAGEIIVPLTAGQLYEIRLTGFATADQVKLDWWSAVPAPAVPHSVTFDPGRDGDPGGFGREPASPQRSYYFLVPDGISEIHYYADKADLLTLWLPDGTGGEVQDLTFQPQSRGYQRHPVNGTGRRVLRIDGVQMNQVGFFLLNCPNLVALTPTELLRPDDA